MVKIECLIVNYSEYIKLSLIILGWLAIPYFNHKLTKKRERIGLINKNIENVENAFQEMNELILQQLDKKDTDITIYYKLINCNQKLLLNSKRLKKIDKGLEINNTSISKIRQYTTNDKIIKKHGHHIMQRLLFEQMTVIESLTQQH